MASDSAASPLKVSVFIATSVDGFIARTDGSIDWLNEANTTVTPGEDCGFKAFMATVDVILMGRHTFEQVLTFNEWPYGTTKMVVMSSGSVAIPERLAGSVSSSSEAPADIVARLGSEGFKRAYIDGGITIQRFLAAGLVDDATITLIPVAIGSGKALFANLTKDVKLKLESCHHWSFGFIQTVFTVVKA